MGTDYPFTTIYSASQAAVFAAQGQFAAALFCFALYGFLISSEGA